MTVRLYDTCTRRLRDVAVLRTRIADGILLDDTPAGAEWSLGG